VVPLRGPPLTNLAHLQGPTPMNKSKIEQLMERVLAASHAKNWNEARMEWVVTGVHKFDDDDIFICLCRRKVWNPVQMRWVVDEPENDQDPPCDCKCVCSHEQLRWVFTIQNRITHKSLYPIGSKCIDHFRRLDMSEAARKLKAQEKKTKTQPPLISQPLSPAQEMEQSDLAMHLHTLLVADVDTPWSDLELAYAGVQEIAGISGNVFEYARGHFERAWALKAAQKSQDVDDRKAKRQKN
jgi:hypothetical protein